MAGNLVYELQGKKFTPPVICGLLKGTLRDELVAQGTVLERILLVDELTDCTNLWFINSVRGWVPVSIAG